MGLGELRRGDLYPLLKAMVDRIVVMKLEELIGDSLPDLETVHDTIYKASDTAWLDPLSLAVVAQYGRGPMLRSSKLVVEGEYSEVIITDEQIEVSDCDGDLRLGIGLANGKAEAMFLDGQGMPRIQLVVEEDSDGTITYRDANGAWQVSTRTMGSGTAKTGYFDQLSKPVLTVGAYKDGTAATKHYDPGGSLRIAIGVDVN